MGNGATIARTAAVFVLAVLCAPAAPAAPGAGSDPGYDPIAQTDAALARLAATRVAPAGWTYAADFDRANRQFLQWQRAMLKQSAQIPPELRKVLYRKTIVPPPAPGQPAPEPQRIRMNIPLAPDPFGLLPTLDVGVGPPTFSAGLTAEGKLLSMVGASYKVGGAYATANNDLAFGHQAVAKLGPDTGDAALCGTWELFAANWGKAPTPPGEPASKAGAELSVKMRRVSASFSYANGELGVGGSYSFLQTPEAFSAVADFSVGFEGGVSAPFTVHGLNHDSRFGLARLSADYAAKVARLLSSPADCPHCARRGELDCGRCSNRRTITCTDCSGRKTRSCTRCSGSGELVCVRCNQGGQESCSSCSGRGQKSCYSCSGRGTVTAYDSVTRSRQELVITRAGFDSSGQPVYERHYETRYYTEQVPRSETCGSCGGSGAGGACGRCGGDGKVTCGRCGGGGAVQCSRCGGSRVEACDRCDGGGRITCPGCNGRPIVCPLCRGRKAIGG